MKTKQLIFKASLLSLAIAGTAQAQTDQLEEVLVTGYKASLKSAMDTKRDSNGVVDAINSEDIGKFPDTNLAESLQRITGVSIDRSGGEGRQITVRGLGPQFNTVLLNGRQMPSANDSRGFNFDTVAAEVVSGVDVYKTSSATMQSGGIGATVNVKTARPLDLGTKSMVSAKLLNETNLSDVTPAISGLYSLNVDDTFGVLAAVSYQSRDFQSDSVEQRRWNWKSRMPATVNANEGVPADQQNWYEVLPGRNGGTVNVDYLPQQSVIKRQEMERERLNATLTFQWQPTDNLAITLDSQYTDLKQTGVEYESAVWYSHNSDNNAVYDVDANGTMIYRTVNNAGLDFFVNAPETQEVGLSTGIEIDWTINDASSLLFGYSTSTAEAQPDLQANISRSDIQAHPIDFTFEVRGDVTSHYYDNADISLANTRVWQYDGYSDPRKDDIDQVRLDYTFETDDLVVKAGAMFTDQTKKVEQYTTLKGGVLQGKYTLVGNDRTTSLFDSIEEAQANGYQVATMNHAILGNISYLDFDPLAFNSWVAHAQGDATATDAQKDLTASTMLRQPNWYEINEETVAFYAEATKYFTLGGRDLTVVAGARYEETSIDSVSLERTLIGLTPPAIEGENYIREFAEDSPFVDGDSYDVFLPNLSIKYDITDDVVLRFAASRSITRPELKDMRSSRNFGDIRQGESGLGNAGNPNLEPFMSDNFDLSAEWYINDFDYVSIGAFTKSIDNFITTTAVSETIRGVIDPATGKDVVYDLTRPQNTDTKKVSGIEVGGQHIFGDTGFGVIANATFVFADPDYDRYTELGDVPEANAVLGVSDSANLVGFYENGPFQVRLAYNWRDEFIRGFQYYYSSTSNEPVTVEAYSQLDLSMSYDLNDNVSIFLEGINITEEGARIHGRQSNQMFYISEGVGRYALGIRASF